MQEAVGKQERIHAGQLLDDSDDRECHGVVAVDLAGDAQLAARSDIIRQSEPDERWSLVVTEVMECALRNDEPQFLIGIA